MGGRKSGDRFSCTNGTLSEGKGSWLFSPTWLFCLSILLIFFRDILSIERALGFPARKSNSTDQVFHGLHPQTARAFSQSTFQSIRRRPAPTRCVSPRMDSRSTPRQLRFLRTR